MLRRTAAATAAALLLAGTAACGSDDDSSSKTTTESLDGLKVTGTFGKKPTLKVDGLDVSKAESAEVIEGDGAEVTKDSYVNYRFLIASGKNGDELANNYAEDKLQQLVVAQQPKIVSDAVVGAHIGSRVAIAAPVEDLVGKGGAPQVGLTAKDDIVLVFDLVEEGDKPLSGPDGEAVDPPADAPKAQADGDTVTGIDFSDAPKAAPKAAGDFEVIPLVEGTGKAVKTGDSITVNYYGAVWGSDKPFDSSFDRGQPASFTLAEGSLIQGWVKGLTGVKVGSRVMLVIPPSLGYADQAQQDIPANSTLVFVVDVLQAQS